MYGFNYKITGHPSTNSQVVRSNYRNISVDVKKEMAGHFFLVILLF